MFSRHIITFGPFLGKKLEFEEIIIFLLLFFFFQQEIVLPDELDVVAHMFDAPHSGKSALVNLVVSQTSSKMRLVTWNVVAGLPWK